MEEINRDKLAIELQANLKIAQTLGLNGEIAIKTAAGMIKSKYGVDLLAEIKSCSKSPNSPKSYIPDFSEDSETPAWEVLGLTALYEQLDMRTDFLQKEIDSRWDALHASERLHKERMAEECLSVKKQHDAIAMAWDEHTASMGVILDKDFEIRQAATMAQAEQELANLKPSFRFN